MSAMKQYIQAILACWRRWGCSLEGRQEGVVGIINKRDAGESSGEEREDSEETEG